MREYIAHRVYNAYNNNKYMSILNIWVTNTINRIFINAGTLSVLIYK